MLRLLSATLALSVLAFPLAAERRIALIIDTSGSMVVNDHSRYAVQISKILSDLVDDQDKVGIVRLPVAQSAAPVIRPGGSFLDFVRQGLQAMKEQGAPQNCDVPADRSLLLELAGTQREVFKTKIDQSLVYNGPTPFGAPLRTAIPFLGEDRNVQRLLLLISDAQEGFGECKAQYTQLLQQFEATEASVALIKIGGYAADDFANNPAIQLREDVQDSARLIDAVAKVYQRFLGSKKVQTGRVSGDITVEIDPHVKEAFLVVAAESELGVMQGRSSNPAADKVDLDYRSGGETRGVGGNDTQTRGYRIVHLTNPAAGSYTFAPPAGTTGGWMLLQDYALVLRMITRGAPLNSSTPVQAEIVDERTGTRVTDGQTLKNITIDGKIDSGMVSLTNDGTGIFTANHQFNRTGSAPVELRLRGGPIDRTYHSSIKVSKNIGKLEPQTPEHPTAGVPLAIRVKLTGGGAPPDHLTAVIDGQRIELNDKGSNGDEHSGDGIYSATWTPDNAGNKKIRFEGESGTNIQPVELDVPVTAAPEKAPPASPPPTPVASAPPTPPPPAPPPPMLAGPNDVDFGQATLVNLGRLTAGGEAQSAIQLSNGRAAREVDIEVSTDFNKRHARMEIQTRSGWRTLSTDPLRTRLTANDPMHWPLRLHLENCPEGCQASEAHKVSFVAHRTDGGEQRVDVPIRVEIIPDAWYVCWRRELFAALGFLAAAIIVHGYVSPFRFGRRLGVQMATTEDLNEGFYFPFRAAAGSGVGFYRDATLFITDEFRVTSRRPGGFVRLRAFKNQVRLRPENGRPVWRQQADGSWEQVNSQQEAAARPGVLYRNDGRTLYFEVRTK